MGDEIASSIALRERFFELDRRFGDAGERGGVGGGARVAGPKEGDFGGHAGEDTTTG
jgi:hypothetical protein